MKFVYRDSSSSLERRTVIYLTVHKVVLKTLTPSLLIWTLREVKG